MFVGGLAGTPVRTNNRSSFSLWCEFFIWNARNGKVFHGRATTTQREHWGDIYIYIYSDYAQVTVMT